ncbi:DUF4367 domain-containing protein [Sinanaerobacter sp. ZZT-01]|uniref:DUF4367 domain-containing protein n=1 Tax=Sinanaerobacter sp. ZZT-01 TaxID=3111540 RepID=UPI002D786469|nr:DUF4367 domain-containing protein [Sinanaerobacter sp. ZZT-01]WRR92459.1 DUF4367 domain-containing protein [Sinanaerobacter sp. ZZT-01]
MCKKIKDEVYERDRHLSQTLIKEAMEDPINELDFFQELNSIQKPTLQSFMEEMDQIEKRKQNPSVYEPIYAGIKEKFFEWGRKNRCYKIAGALILFLFLTTIVTSFFKIEPSIAGKIKLNLFGKEIENGFVEDSHVGVEEPQTIEEIVEDERYIDAMNEKYDQLVVPGYIPEDYAFESLTVKKSGNKNFKAIYIYQDDENTKVILSQRAFNDDQGAVFANAIEGFEELEKDKVFYQEDQNLNGVSVLLIVYDDYTISISGTLEKDELLKIKEKLKH